MEYLRRKTSPISDNESNKSSANAYGNCGCGTPNTNGGKKRSTGTTSGNFGPGTKNTNVGTKPNVCCLSNKRTLTASSSK